MILVIFGDVIGNVDFYNMGYIAPNPSPSPNSGRGARTSSPGSGGGWEGVAV
jgi:hypothetical protein